MLKPYLRKKFYLYFSLLSIILLILTGSYFSTIYIEKDIKEKILETSTNDVFEIANNTAIDIKNFILKNKQEFNLLTNNEYAKLDKNNYFFYTLDEKIQTLKTKNIKYAYLLYVDKDEVFKFIADASINNDKAKPNEIFDIDSSIWLEVYKSKKPTVIKHNFSNELSITYLKPLIVENRTIILVIDFSTKKIDEISSNISNIKTFLLSFWGLIFILLLVLIYQAFKTYKVRRDSYIDRLTGVYSRNYLQDYEMFLDLKKYIICAIDVDFFKKVNDTYGHTVGDYILIQIANTLKSEIRKNKDILIRYGGEEFCLLIHKNTLNNETSLNFLERIHNKFKNKKFLISKNEEISITVSIGVNTNPHHQRDFISAFKLADVALYNAKNKGRNTIEIYEEINNTDEQFLTIDDIKDAITKKNVICYYQEIKYEESNSNIKHYEALVRIIKDGKIHLPEKFLPTIKNTFITTRLTKELLSIIYKKLKNNSEIFISINLTPQDLQNETIINILISYAKMANISSRIALEIVETDEILNYEKITITLLMLKKLEYKIYIDDFGSGYSNFIYLTKIKADAIKIDGSIIKSINDDKLSYLVAKNIISFAREANIDVIAEYVSTKEIYNATKELGINKFQGYYFSEPS